jgi:DNA-binding PadR family transcriptional regulator
LVLARQNLADGLPVGGVMRETSSRAKLEALVLRALCLREMSGVDLSNLLADKGLDLCEGSVYAILRGLEHSGLVVGVWVDVGTELPRRRYYQLTARGDLVASRSTAQGLRLAPSTQVGGTRS